MALQCPISVRLGRARFGHAVFEFSHRLPNVIGGGGWGDCEFEEPRNARESRQRGGRRELKSLAEREGLTSTAFVLP